MSLLGDHNINSNSAMLSEYALIDTHAHLYSRKFDHDREEMIARAREAGVRIVVLPAIDVSSILDALELCDAHEGFFAMAALHPTEVKDATEEDFQQVVKFCEDPRVVAVGESGLDYYWDRSFDDLQHTYLKRHAHLAAEMDLPLILHNREASDDLVRILSEVKGSLDQPERLRGIFHCFGGPTGIGEAAWSLGFFLGIGGTVTFKNSGVAEVVREIPIERIVLETDAPYLAPVPFRGRRNESAYVRLVAERVAEVKEMSLEDVCRITTENALALFRLDLPGDL
jgi:TatD DNase family protein